MITQDIRSSALLNNLSKEEEEKYVSRSPAPPHTSQSNGGTATTAGEKTATGDSRDPEGEGTVKEEGSGGDDGVREEGETRQEGEGEGDGGKGERGDENTTDPDGHNASEEKPATHQTTDDSNISET